MQTKRILVMSGGGSRGAFQAGAVHALLRNGLTFDAYLGVSVGSLNAALMGAHPDPRGRGETERRWLWDMWRTADPGVQGHYDRVFSPFRSRLIEGLRTKAEAGRTAWLRRLVLAGVAATPGLAMRARQDWRRLLAHTRLDRARPRFPGLGEGESGGVELGALARQLGAAFRPGGMLHDGLPVFQSLDRLQEHYLEDPSFLPPLRDLWEADAPIWMGFVCLHDGRYITATTQRSLKPFQEQLPGVFFLDPDAGWTSQDLWDCLTASAAIPVRMTLREVRVPDKVDPSKTHPPGARYMLEQNPGTTYRACADGGLRSILPAAEAVRLADAMLGRAWEVGEPGFEALEIYLVTNASRDRTPPLTESTSALRRLTRYLDVMQEEILGNDFAELDLLHAVMEIARLDPGSLNLDPEDSSFGPDVTQSAYLDGIGEREEAIRKSFGGAQLVQHPPMRLIEAGIRPEVFVVEPDFRAPWPERPDRTVDDLFADLLSFEARILRDRWEHGVVRAHEALAAGPRLTVGS